MTPLILFKCLSDETRLLCLLLIAKENELCVCELTAMLELSQPKVSRHLAHLRACGLVLDRKQGLWKFYRINTSLPAWVLAVLNTTLEEYTNDLQSYMSKLEAMGSRPERATICGQSI